MKNNNIEKHLFKYGLTEVSAGITGLFVLAGSLSAYVVKPEDLAKVVSIGLFSFAGLFAVQTYVQYKKIPKRKRNK